jgi:membrane protein DedA with SNARE-associated domain
MPYPKFLTYNAAGGLVWGIGFVLLGYLAGNSYAAIEQTVGRWAALVVLTIVIAAILIWRTANTAPRAAASARRTD